MTQILTQINSAISNNNGQAISKFFSVSHLISQKEQCKSLIKESERFSFKNKTIDWRKVFANLFSVPGAATPEKGLLFFEQAASAFIRNFFDFENSLRIPILKEISHSYREIAETCEFNTCVQRIRHIYPISRKTNEEPYAEYGSPLLSVTNDLLELFFERNDFKQAASFIEGYEEDVKKREKDGIFTISELASFYFNNGKICTVMGNISKAIICLEKAILYTPSSAANDKRMIYSLLIANKLTTGAIPSKELIEKYSLDIYNGIINAIVNADLVAFDKALEENTLIFIRIGVWDSVSKSKIIIYRRLLEGVCRMVMKLNEGQPRFNLVPLECFRGAISVQVEHTMEEAETILANLIKENLCKANISDALLTIILSKNDPFPPLPLPVQE